MKTTTNNGSVIELEEPKAAPAGCDCWEQTDLKLKERGFRLASSLSALKWAPSGSLPVLRLLPLERADGKKPRVGDPKTLEMSFCPFCGKAIGRSSIPA